MTLFPALLAVLQVSVLTKAVYVRFTLKCSLISKQLLPFSVAVVVDVYNSYKPHFPQLLVRAFCEIDVFSCIEMMILILAHEGRIQLEDFIQVHDALSLLAAMQLDSAWCGVEKCSDSNFPTAVFGL